MEAENREQLPDTFSQQLHDRLSKIEKRDWELWSLALGMVAILAIGYAFVIFPAIFMGQRTFFVQARVSSQLVIGQLVLVILFLIYLAYKQMKIRGLRSQSILEALNFQLSHAQLLLDPLTQAFNRSALEEIINKEIKRVYRKQATLVFLYLDVNDLKVVNTRFGHLSGDLVLAEVGAILKQCVRGSDYVVRMGGDEFLVALVDTDVPGAEAVKRRINDKIEIWNQGSRLPGFDLDVSMGIKEFDGSLPLDEVLAEADARMYDEKKSRPWVKGA